MKELIEQKFAQYRDEMLADLAELVAINSVATDPTPGHPFGDGSAAAIDKMLSFGKRMGFRTVNDDYYAGAIEYGDGEESVGILGHLDVVPAGKGWDTDPFQMVIKDDVLYGRGVMDDKGPLIASLYGLRIIKELNIPLKRRITIICGGDEERGCDDIPHYLSNYPAPTLGFTPDSDYPVTYGEKGLFRGDLVFGAEDTPVLSFKGGEVYNAVISECEVLLDSSVNADALRASLRGEDTLNFPVTIETLADGTVRMLVKGQSAHGSTPQLGVNAAVSAALILCRFLGERVGKALHFLCEVLGRENNGMTAGVFCEDELGPLTLNIGKANLTQAGGFFGIDIRIPIIRGSADEVINGLKVLAEKHGFCLENVHATKSLYVPPESEIVTKLIAVYRDATGDQEAQAHTTGGGTYAKCIGHDFVAFGAELPGMIDPHIHDVNERHPLDNFFKHCLITTLAMIELAK